MQISKKSTTGICFIMLFVFSIVLTMTSPLLPYIAEAYSLTLVQSGMIFTANFTGFIIFTIAGGLLADRYGKKRVILIALGGLAMSLTAFPAAGSFYAVCMVTAFIGGFGGIIESLTSAWIGDLNSERPSFYINLSGVFFGIGALVGPVAIGTALSHGLEWRFFYYYTGALCFALAAAASFGRADSSNTSGISTASVRRLFTDLRFMLVCLCMLFYTGAEIGSWGWMCTFLKDTMYFSPVKSSLALGLFWAAMTLGRFISGFLLLRFSIGSIIVALSGAASAITLMSAFVYNEAGIWLTIFIMGASYSAQWNLILAFGGEAYKDISGTVFAILVASGGLGGMVVPYAMGIMAQETGMRAAMASPSILLAAISVIFISMGKGSGRFTKVKEKAENG